MVNELAGLVAAENIDARREKREHDDMDGKKITSANRHAFLESIEVRDHARLMMSTSHCQDLVQPDSSLMTGGKPAKMRKRHSTTEVMKLTTWVRGRQRPRS